MESVSIATLICLVIVILAFAYTVRYVNRIEHLHSASEADIVLSVPVVFSDKRELGNSYYGKEMGYTPMYGNGNGNGK